MREQPSWTYLLQGSGVQCHLFTACCCLTNLPNYLFISIYFIFRESTGLYDFTWIFSEICTYHKVWVLSVFRNVNTCFLNLSCLSPPTHLHKMRRLSSRHMHTSVIWMDRFFQLFRGRTVVHWLKGIESKQCSTKHLLIVTVIWEDFIYRILGRLSSCKWVKLRD